MLPFEENNKVLDITLNSDAGTCYISLNFENFFYNFLSPQEKIEQFNGHKNKDTLATQEKFVTLVLFELIEPLLISNRLPITFRQSIGMSLTTLDQCSTALRLKIGIEPIKMLNQYSIFFAEIAIILGIVSNKKILFVPSKAKRYFEQVVQSLNNKNRWAIYPDFNLVGEENERIDIYYHPQKKTKKHPTKKRLVKRGFHPFQNSISKKGFYCLNRKSNIPPLNNQPSFFLFIPLSIERLLEDDLVLSEEDNINFSGLKLKDIFNLSDSNTHARFIIIALLCRLIEREEIQFSASCSSSEIKLLGFTRLENDFLDDTIIIETNLGKITACVERDANAYSFLFETDKGEKFSNENTYVHFNKEHDPVLLSLLTDQESVYVSLHGEKLNACIEEGKLILSNQDIREIYRERSQLQENIEGNSAHTTNFIAKTNTTTRIKKSTTSPKRAKPVMENSKSNTLKKDDILIPFQSNQRVSYRTPQSKQHFEIGYAAGTRQNNCFIHSLMQLKNRNRVDNLSPEKEQEFQQEANQLRQELEIPLNSSIEFIQGEANLIAKKLSEKIGINVKVYTQISSNAIKYVGKIMGRPGSKIQGAITNTGGGHYVPLWPVLSLDSQAYSAQAKNPILSNQSSAPPSGQSSLSVRSGGSPPRPGSSPAQSVPSTIPGRSRKGLFREGNPKHQAAKAWFQTRLDSHDLVMGSAFDDGDCFFDAMAQALTAIGSKQKDGKPYTDKLLRKICSQSAQALNRPGFENWIEEKVTQDAASGQTYRYYLENIDKNAPEIGTGIIWGRPHIDGQILAQRLNVTIHLQDIFYIEENLALEHKITDSRGTRMVSETEAYSIQTRVIRLANYESALHYVPLMKR